MKFFLVLTLAFIKRFRFVLISSVIVGLAFFYIAEKIIPNLNTLKTTSVGLTGRFTPEELPDFILKQISKGLTHINEDGSVVPSLADWETPDKGKTWIFKLKDNVFWQDGKKLTTEDIHFEFSDAEIVKESPLSITFKLKDPFVPFPSVVAKPLFKKGLLGLGEWEVKKLVLNGSFVQELYVQNSLKQKIVYKFYPTSEATKTAFKLGKVDRVENLLEFEPFNKWSTANVVSSINPNQIVTLFFNTQDEILSDKSIRQALTYALDKNAMGSRALSSIASNSWAYNPQVKEYEYNLNHAKEILKDIPQKVKDEAQIELITTPSLVAKADIIAKAWSSIGIKTNVQVSSVIPSEFQVFLTILDVPTDPDQYPLWHSTQTATNISRYASPRIDKLLEDGRVELDINERKRIYLDFQRFLLEDVPAAFLYNPEYFTVSRK